MKKYVDVFQHLPLPALLLEGNTRILDVNESGQTTFGQAAVLHDMLGWLRQDLDDFLIGTEPVRVIEKSRHEADGSTKFYRVRISKVDCDGVSILTFTDVTERRRTLEELGRLASIVDSTDDAIISIALDRSILSWNHGAEKIFGYPSADARGMSYMRLIPSSISHEIDHILHEVARGRTHKRYETINRQQSGFLFPVSCTYSPLVSSDETIGISVVTRDISSRRHVEDQLRASHKKLQSLLEETVNSLSTAHEKRDLYTSGHQQKVSRIACVIAEHLGMPQDDIEGLRIAGLLHDIGKVCIPMAILAKPALLTPEEMAIMKQHPHVGFDIVKNVPFPWPVGKIILQHHERMDGSGYPFGLSEAEILQQSRVLAVADTLEAISSHRPYRPARGIEVAMSEILKGRGTRYDEDVCECLKALVEQGRIGFRGNELHC